MKRFLSRAAALRLAALSLLSALCLTLGCLPTYVGDPTKSVVDANYVGYWYSAKDNNRGLWVVHKMDEHCYLVQAYNFTADDAGAVKMDSQLTARAWLAKVGEKTFFSMELYDPQMLLASGKDKLDQRYIVGACKIENDTLSIKPVDPSFVKTEQITTPEKFEAALKKATSDDGVYLEEVPYKRLKSDDDTLKQLLKLIE